MIDDDLSPDLRDLFHAERRRDDVPAGAKDRVHAALSASIGLGVGTAGAAKTAIAAKAAGGGAAVAKAGAAGGAVSAASGAAGATAVTATGGALAKGLAFALVAAMAGTAGTGVYLAQRDDPPPAIAAPQPAADDDGAWDPSILGKKTPEPPPLAEKPRPQAEAPAVVEVKPAPVVERAAEPVRETPEEKAARLAGERTVLDDARAAVGRGDGGAALIALEAHRTRFPDGALVEEREALTVLALAKLGRTEEAQAKAEKFRARYPSSLLMGAVDAAAPR